LTRPFSFLKDDDYAPDDISYESRTSTNLIHSSLIKNCLTITEENDEELEQLKRDDDDEEFKKQNYLFKINDELNSKIILHDNDDRADLLENENSIDKQRTIMNQNYDERLSTIYESPSPQPRTEDDEIYDDAYDKLVVYDVANNNPIEKVNLNNLKIVIRSFSFS
jgi:hypothetical protein